MAQLLYRFIYARYPNFLIRNLLKWLPLKSDKVKLPPSGRVRVRLKHASFHLYTNQTCFVSHLIFWYSPENFEYTRLFTELIKRVNTFYDIGANIGYYSLLGARLNPDLQVMAFEPARGPKHYLKLNIAKNNLKKRIHLTESAISDKEGLIKFQEVKNAKYTYLDYNLSGENNLVNKKASKEFVATEVVSSTLDNFVLQGRAFPELIKIDTEGAEPLVLKGGIQTITKFRPIVICEILKGAEGDEITAFFEALAGYSKYALEGVRIKPVTDLNKGIEPDYVDFLFCPEEKKGIIKDFID